MKETIKEIWGILPRRLQGFSLAIPLMIYVQLTGYLNKLFLSFSANAGFWFSLLTVLILVAVMLDLINWLTEYELFTKRYTR